MKLRVYRLKTEVHSVRHYNVSARIFIHDGITGKAYILPNQP